MAENVFISSGAVASRDISIVLEECRKAGVRYLELASGLPCEAEGLEQLQSAKKEEGFSYLIHNYFPAPKKPFALNLAAAEPETLEKSRAHCRNAIDLCHQFGVPFFSVHSGFAVPVQAEDLGNPEAWLSRQRKAGVDMDAAREIFSNSVREIADYALNKGVRLLLENNVVSPKLTCGDNREHGLLLSEGKEIADFFHNLQHSNTGLLLDVGHAKVSSTALGFSLDHFMDAVSEHVEAFHLSDNDGQNDSNKMIDANSWFVPYLSDYANAYYVIEVYKLNHEQISRQYHETRKLLSQ